MPFPTGCEFDLAARDEFRDELDAQGGASPFGADSELQGLWGRLKAAGTTHVFAFEGERQLHGGKYLPSWCQANTRQTPDAGFGWCVGAGTGRAIQTSVWSEIARGLLVGDVLPVAWEPLYALARQRGFQKGRRLGGSGAYGVDAAHVAHDGGVTFRGVYGEIDLTKQRAGDAYRWSQRNARVPQELVDAGREFTCRAMYCDQAQERRDVLARGLCYAICSEIAWVQQRKSQLWVPQSGGGHCEHACGICVGENGDDIVIRRNSHCRDQQQTLRFAGGEVLLPPGAYPVKATDEDSTCRGNWEAWAFQIKAAPRPDSLADFVKQGESQA